MLAESVGTSSCRTISMLYDIMGQFCNRWLNYRLTNLGLKLNVSRKKYDFIHYMYFQFN